MTDEAMKAACVQAAGTLLAAWWHAMRCADSPPPPSAELDGNAVMCANLAGTLYTEVSKIDWKVHPNALPAGVHVAHRKTPY